MCLFWACILSLFFCVEEKNCTVCLTRKLHSNDEWASECDPLSTSILAWRILWTEEPGRLSPWSRRVGHNGGTFHSLTGYCDQCQGELGICSLGLWQIYRSVSSRGRTWLLSCLPPVEVGIHCTYCLGNWNNATVP